MYAHISLSLAFLIAAMAITVYVAVHHLAIGIGARAGRVHLWVAAFCGASLLFEAAQLAQRLTSAPQTAVFAMRLQWATVGLLQWILVELTRELTGERRAPWLPPTLKAFGAVTAVLCLGTPWIATEATRPWTDALGDTFFWVELAPLSSALSLVPIALLVYCVRLFQKAEAIDIHSRLIFAGGFVVYVLTGTHDVLMSILRFRSVVLFGFAFFVLAVVFDVLVVRKFRATYANLGREVEAQTKALRATNVRLLAALEEASAAAKARSDFVAGMSHEIRTPLNGVLGMLDLLGQTELSARQRSLVATMESSGLALMDIINQVLDFSRGEAARLSLHTTEIDVAAIAEEIVLQQAQRAQLKGLELAVVVDPKVPPLVMVDRARITQILTNFLGNAIKFTRSGHVVVRVWARESDLRFEVSDTGIGLPREKLDTIFEPFVQADASINRAFGGTGLGLAICRQLVTLMEGEIGVESRVGEGSLFWFTIPLVEGARRAQPPPPTQSPVVVATTSELTREMMNAQLRALGVDPRFVEDLAAATPGEGEVWFLDSYPIDVIEAFEARARARSVLRLVRVIDEVEGDGSRAVPKPTSRAQLADLLAGASAPRQQPPSRRPAPPLAAPEAPSAIPALRVLLVEDNEVNRMVAQLMLARMGVGVVVARDGEEAVRVFEEDTGLAVILMDCQMPNVDGYEATRRIRAIEAAFKRPRIPILAVSASAIPEEVERALLVGMDAYVTKPVRSKVLREALERVLGRERAALLRGEPPAADARE